MPDWFDANQEIWSGAAYPQDPSTVDPRVYGGAQGPIARPPTSVQDPQGNEMFNAPLLQNNGMSAPAGGGQPFSYDAFAKRAGELSQGASGTLKEFQQRILPQLQQEFPGIQGFGSKGDKIRLPNGQTIDAVVSAGVGGRGYNWGIEQPGGGGGGAPSGSVAGMGDLGWSGLGPSGAGGASGINVGNYSSTPLSQAQNYTPQDAAGPDKLSLASIAQPGEVRADQVGPGERVNAGTVQTGERVNAATVGAPDRVTAQQVQGPQALTARNVADPTGFQNLTADQLQQDPSYQFRLKQGLGAMQNAAAAKGLLRSGATLKGLQDYAGESASQEYQAANERARQTYQQNLGNQQSVTGQNNAAQAQAYGLTNQFQQGAALANQGADLNAQQFNVGSAQQAGMFNAGQTQGAQQFNSGQQQQANLANVGNALNAAQFNSAQGQQAALANQSANLNAGQFNAGMNFNTQQSNIANQLAAYQAYQGLNQQNRQFNAGRADQAFQNNFQNRFAVEQGNNANSLGAYNANVNAQLGAGSLANQAAANANSYNLGLGNLSLGNKQADQSYNLGLGQQGLGWANFGLNQQGQDFNQGLQTFNTNYGVYRDNRDTAFQQNYALAGLGQNSAMNYGNQAGNAYSNQGAANANARMAGAGAWSGALGTLGNTAQQAAYWNATRPPQGGYGGLYLDPTQGQRL